MGAIFARAVRTFFAASKIDPAKYRERGGVWSGPDPSDLVHAAACAHGGVDVLVTKNLRDFPVAVLSEHGVRVCSADEYLLALLRRRPAAFVETVRRLASEKRRPPMAACDLAARLRVGGAHRLADALANRLGCSEKSGGASTA